MKLLANDTPFEVEAMQLEMIRQTPVWRRLEIVAELNESVKKMALAGLRSRHPNASPTELRRRLADLYLGPELAERVYGPLATAALPEPESD
ncbi:MAG: hypothetical protein JO316_13125 [Abitibacteriaceae bacterium]|nr:hypothetical protein [Abditibacteriaceae bacterium]MBV9866287.1 hypothetical protein [Abditibacteriaceae bacterium]